MLNLNFHFCWSIRDVWILSLLLKLIWLLCLFETLPYCETGNYRLNSIHINDIPGNRVKFKLRFSRFNCSNLRLFKVSQSVVRLESLQIMRTQRPNSCKIGQDALLTVLYNFSVIISSSAEPLTNYFTVIIDSSRRPPPRILLHRWLALIQSNQRTKLYR